MAQFEVDDTVTVNLPKSEHHGKDGIVTLVTDHAVQVVMNESGEEHSFGPGALKEYLEMDALPAFPGLAPPRIEL